MQARGVAPENSGCRKRGYKFYMSCVASFCWPKPAVLPFTELLVSLLSIQMSIGSASSFENRAVRDEYSIGERSLELLMFMLVSKFPCEYTREKFCHIRIVPSNRKVLRARHPAVLQSQLHRTYTYIYGL